MSAKDLLLAIDNGTQSIKALLFDPEGNLLAKEQVHFEPYFSIKPGWTEQDPLVYWDSLCTACQRLWKREGVDKSRIAGVSLTTQRSSVINVDDKGNPLRPAMLWLDQRKTENHPGAGPLWYALFAVVGAKSTVDHFLSEAQSSWIMTRQPEIWKNTHKYLLLSGYLTFKLLDKFVDSTSSQVGYIPFNYRKLKWANSLDFRWRAQGLKPRQMPELIEAAKVLGEITSQASEATGIPKGLPLIAGAADKACEVLGSGGLEPSLGCLSYGTTATINVASNKPVSPFWLAPPYPAAIPGAYNIEVEIFRGYWMVSWFKKEFGFEERMEAMEKGTEPEILFEKLVEEAPPGSMGLMLQPYWTPGIKHPGPEGKGAIIGFGDVHTRAHVYRSILEGLAYALREGKERLEKRTGTPINRLAVSGGGSQSDSAMQITADVFGLPAVRPHLYETSGLGAAMIAAVGLGLHKDFSQAVSAMTRPGAEFLPIEENRQLYNRLYKEVFLKMYKRLGPIYKSIRDITGYPS
ncbi:carbohydrate kinase FGGY [Desulfatibacillum aliphaticivorans]|uniref:Carbohydrate kinase FGGY n=1 Tax=Desulfatibacillum aliphaticivorans TaxID=218208 RepID=B8FGF7_DESAL|nr:FGGY-family carbohydrate kinase [Desulfatibacillum aliphaticivorans]ACL04866.1 carbohydrate kinase FGGY [Desulfatibacillum aliphaticivorans]